MSNPIIIILGILNLMLQEILTLLFNHQSNLQGY